MVLTTGLVWGVDPLGCLMDNLGFQPPITSVSGKFNLRIRVRCSKCQEFMPFNVSEGVIVEVLPNCPNCEKDLRKDLIDGVIKKVKEDGWVMVHK